LCNLQQLLLKIAVFTYRSPHFCVPWRRPCDYHDRVAWIERQLNACKTPRSKYLSIFNNFRVIRCLIQCVSPKIAIFTTFFVSPGDAPGVITLNVVWMEREFDAYKLSSTVSQLFEPQVQKIAIFTYRSPYFCFPWKRPFDYHAICCMDGKTIQCLPNSSQHVPIFNSFRVIRCLSQCVSPKIAIFGDTLGQSR